MDTEYLCNQKKKKQKMTADMILFGLFQPNVLHPVSKICFYSFVICQMWGMIRNIIIRIYVKAKYRFIQFHYTYSDHLNATDLSLS